MTSQDRHGVHLFTVLELFDPNTTFPKHLFTEPCKVREVLGVASGFTDTVLDLKNKNSSCLFKSLRVCILSPGLSGVVSEHVVKYMRLVCYPNMTSTDTSRGHPSLDPRGFRGDPLYV